METTIAKTLDQFIAENRISMTSERTDSNPAMDESRDMDHWKCRLRCRGRSMTMTFSMGYAHNGKAPKAADVLDCLASDASGAAESWTATRPRCIRGTAL